MFYYFVVTQNLEDFKILDAKTCKNVKIGAGSLGQIAVLGGNKNANSINRRHRCVFISSNRWNMEALTKILPIRE